MKKYIKRNYLHYNDHVNNKINVICSSMCVKICKSLCKAIFNKMVVDGMYTQSENQKLDNFSLGHTS